jgi:hypothetical protein
LRVKTTAKPPVPVKTATKPVSAPKTPLPPRPAVASKSTPPAPLVGKKPLPPRPVVVSPTNGPVAPVVTPAPAPSAVKPPLPLKVAPPVEAKAQQPSHTDIDLPPYIERPPSLILDDEDSDPDLLRRFQSDVVERRKRLTRLVATVVGVAWMLCQIACARSIASTVVDAIGSEDEAPPVKAVVSKDVAKDTKSRR